MYAAELGTYILLLPFIQDALPCFRRLGLNAALGRAETSLFYYGPNPSTKRDPITERKGFIQFILLYYDDGRSSLASVPVGKRIGDWRAHHTNKSGTSVSMPFSLASFFDFFFSVKRAYCASHN